MVTSSKLLLGRAKTRPWLIGLFLVLWAAAPGWAQDRPLGATRNQKKDLAPLIDVLVDQLSLLTSDGEEKAIRRRITKALEVQVSWKAMLRYDAEIKELIAEDLGLKGEEALEVIERNLVSTYFRSPKPAELALLIPTLPDYPEFGSEDERVAFEKEREVERRKLKQAELAVKSLAYPAVNVEKMHESCMRHEELALIDLRSRAPKELERSAEKAVGLLARHYTSQVAATFGVEEDKALTERIEVALARPSTEAALLGFLVRMRAVVRPRVHAEEGVTGDPAHVCEVETKVIDEVCRLVGAAEWWSKLRADHVAILEDPRSASKDLASRGK